jgi:hypothetical protein
MIHYTISAVFGPFVALLSILKVYGIVWNRNMVRVFMTHSNDEDAPTTAVYRALESAGFRVWADHMDCTGDYDDCQAQIYDAMEHSDVGLILLSPRSAASKDCCDEWQRIIDQGKPLVVVQLIPVPERDLPPNFPRIEQIDLSRDFTKGTQQLIEKIRSVTASIGAGTA